jgi:hypothetical protein
MHRHGVGVLGALAILGGVGCKAGDATLAAGGLDWEVRDGSWHVEGDDLVGSAGNVMTKEAVGDGTLELDYELVKGPGGRTVGIGFRMQPGSDPGKSSGYGFNVTTGATTYNLFEGAEGNWQPVKAGQTSFVPSPALGPGKNHVVVRAQGKSFTIEANGQAVASFEDDTYATGRLNLWVESTVDSVRFSKIRWQP